MAIKLKFTTLECSLELTLAVYVDQVCTKAIDLKISDIQATTDTSLDIAGEERNRDNEVRVGSL